MRMIGTLAKEDEARKLGDYLLTLNITSRLDSTKDGWVVWVHDEGQVEHARQEFAEFVENPTDSKYQGIDHVARAVRKRLEKQEKDHERNTIDLRGRRNYRPVRRCPVTYALMWASVAVALLTSLGSSHNPIQDSLYITEIRLVPTETRTIGEDGRERTRVAWQEEWNDLESVKKGQIWRLVSPMFLHFGLLHIVFNMLWLFDLGGMVEMRRGSVRLAVLVLVISAVSNLAQYYVEDPRFGGMSGVVYGLFGYVWIKSHYDPGSGLSLRQGTISTMLIWFLLCVANVIPNVANAAHGAGLAAGALIAFVPHVRQEIRRWI
jgi:rhomboid protease GlpG